MSYSEDEVKRVAELREWFVKQLNEKEDEVARLKAALTLIDGMLKQVSFRPAVTLSQTAGKEVTEHGEARPLKTKDNVVLANAYTSPTSVTIVPASQFKLSTSTPPFQSFFLSRILEGMKGKDTERVELGQLRSDEMISYSIEEEDGVIKKIVVNNYRERERLNEILNTATWVFARMLEKTR